MAYPKVYKLLPVIVVGSILLFFIFRTTPIDTLLLNEWSLSVEIEKVRTENHGCVRLPFLGEDSHIRYAHRGIFWYSSSFDIEALRPCTLTIAGCDDSSEVYINDVFAGKINGMSRDVSVPITQYIRDGKNEVRIKLINSGGSGALYQPIQVCFTTNHQCVDVHCKGKAKQSPYIVYEIDCKKGTGPKSLKAVREMLSDVPCSVPSVVYLSNIYQTSEIARYGGWQQRNAIRNHFAVDERIGSKEDFRDVVTLARTMNIRVVVDFIADRVAWDSDILLLHPEWFVKNENGDILSPSCAEPEVAKLNVKSHEVKKYLLSVMRYWVDSIGVDGFYCSYVHEVPLQFWEIARNYLKKNDLVLLTRNAPRMYHNSFDGVVRCDIGSVIEKIVLGKRRNAMLHELFGVENCGNSVTVCTINPDEVRKAQQISDSDIQSLYIVGTVWQFLLPGAKYISSTQYLYCNKILDRLETFSVEGSEGGCTFSSEVGRDSVVIVRKHCAGKTLISISNFSTKTQRIELESCDWTGILFQHRVEKSGKYFVSLRRFGTIVLIAHGRRGA